MASFHKVISGKLFFFTLPPKQSVCRTYQERKLKHKVASYFNTQSTIFLFFSSFQHNASHKGIQAFIQVTNLRKKRKKKRKPRPKRKYGSLTFKRPKLTQNSTGMKQIRSSFKQIYFLPARTQICINKNQIF